uniref:Ig-like domain-containing protein n=1 Tax=Xiphophorus couchianus TaxID=32473 RepID=A0A3B5L6T6_9TELE
MYFVQVYSKPSTTHYCLAALFTVEAEHTSYNSEYGGNVVMGCRFSSKPANSQNDLKVIWHWMDGSPDQEVIRLVGNLESSSSSKFKGRVKLLTDELKNSWAKIQISDLRITDSGTYQCLVQTTEGTDYKTIALSVGAPYHSVSKQIERTAEGDKVVLTCQSEGYPQSPVVWQDGHLQSYSSNTTTTTTPDGLIKVVSQIEVSSSEKTKYTCNFTKDHSSATFHIPDDIPLRQGENDILIVVLCVGLVLTAIGLGVVIYRRRKGNCLLIQLNTEPKLNVIYSRIYSQIPVKSCYLREGLPGSGKTTVADILLSSWTNAASIFLDASFLDLLMYVNCTTWKVTCSRKQECGSILVEKISAEKLRTILSQSNKTLRFLSERGYYRALVTSFACDCPVLEQDLKTRGTLKCQEQSTKY